jgi:electron transport complex protein RnfG
MRDLARSVWVLFLICVLTTAALAVTFGATRGIIAQREADDADALRRQVLPGQDRYEAMETGPADAAGGVLAIYRGVTGDQTAGYIMTTTAKGYGGPVTLMTGIAPDGRIMGVAVLSAAETPGLGARISEKAFTGRFDGVAPTSGFRTVKTAPTAAGDIEVLTGATISSRAVVDAVNIALRTFTDISGKEGDGHGQ